MKQPSGKQAGKGGSSKAATATTKQSGLPGGRTWGFVLAVALLLGGGYWGWKLNHPPGPSESGKSTDTNTNGTATASATTNSDLQKLVGRWLRPDGGYILEIRSVDREGKLEAAYLNPRSINVAKAVALRDGTVIKVYVELRDVNYPGSTYTLVYDQGSDQLQGNYFQALERQNFDVSFERMK
jgi:hypothetical protein